jgi:hypothetical protein
LVYVLSVKRNIRLLLKEMNSAVVPRNTFRISAQHLAAVFIKKLLVAAASEPDRQTILFCQKCTAEFPAFFAVD